MTDNPEFLEIEVKDNWGNLSYRFNGWPVTHGDQFKALMPNGKTIPVRAYFERVTVQVGDHGGPYNVSTFRLRMQPIKPLAFMGQPIEFLTDIVPLTKMTFCPME